MVGDMRSEELNLSFQRLVMFGSELGKMQGGGVISEWKDIPMELLLRIMGLVDDRTIIMASGVCSGWRDAICLGLTHLSFSWCKKNMNELVLSLAPKFKNLKSLVLRQEKPQLLDAAVEAIANNCHDLQDLDLRKSLKLTDLSLYTLGCGCPNLVKLNISGCTSFSDFALAQLTSCCTKLKVLNLCGCGKAVSDRALEAIAENCRKLQILNLGWCEEISDKGVSSLAYGCPDLRALDLCGCHRITDESIVALASNCPHLRSLGLYYCQNITDRAMYSLAANSRVKRKHNLWQQQQQPSKAKYDDEGLMNLNISQCTALTPHAVQAVCDSYPALHTCPGRHSLIISGCLSLTSVHCACAFQSHRVATMQAH